MALLVSNIIKDVSLSDNDAVLAAISILNVESDDVENAYIYKKSLDARRQNISYVYSVCVQLKNKAQEKKLCSINGVSEYTPFSLNVIKGKQKMKHRPVIIGFGPCGMFAALLLAKNGYNPIVLERGADIDSRVNAVNCFFEKARLDVNTNIQFGEGGAGTFSDGKLTTRINDVKCTHILNEFIRHGAPKEIAYLSKPHIGTDLLQNIIKSIRKEIIACGGQVHFNTLVTDILYKNNSVCGVEINGKDIIESDNVILAIGHSARDTYFKLIDKNIDIIAKSFSVGVRIEHLQEQVNYALYHTHDTKHLPVGSYNVSYAGGSRGVYSFCMCPGGTVVAAASEPESVVVNGMSQHSRSGKNANSAVCVSVFPSDFNSNPKDAISFQRMLENKAYLMGGENYFAPVSLVSDFLDNTVSKRFFNVTPSYPIGTTFCNFNQLLPDFISSNLKQGLHQFSKKYSFFAEKDAVLTGVETRTSAPLRILRDESFMALHIKNLYPAGEGAGYAGGIMSSAADGLNISLSIMEHYAPV